MAPLHHHFEKMGYDERDIVKGLAIAEEILINYDTVDSVAYNNLIDMIYSNTDIASELVVRVNTTKAHVASILQRLEVEDRLQAALKAIKNKIV